MTVSSVREEGPPGLDTTTPNVARMYDYLLGGKDNFAADRAAAEQLLAVIPDVAAIAADNRAFLGRAVRYLTSQGIRQFLDLGSGLPTRSNVHEVAQRDAPGTRVVYADYDPVVALHGNALLAGGDDVAVLRADLTDPRSILEHPDLLKVLDLSQPVGLICVSALHFVSDEADPWGIITEYRDRLCSGSYLVITHAPSRVPGEDPEHDEENAAQVFRQTSAPLHMRTLAQIQRFFDGFELVAPGVVFMQDWHPDPGLTPLAGSGHSGGSRPQAVARPPGSLRCGRRAASLRGRRPWVQDAQPLGAAGHRHVEVVAAARRSGEDRGRVGDEHRVELQALGLPGARGARPRSSGRGCRRTTRRARRGRRLPLVPVPGRRAR